MTGAEQVLVERLVPAVPQPLDRHRRRSAPDGALYASAGDGASFNFADYGQTATNPCGDPPSPAGTSLTPPTAQGGALRSQDLRDQRPAGDPRRHDHPRRPEHRRRPARQPLRLERRRRTPAGSSPTACATLPVRASGPGTERAVGRRRRLEHLGGDQPDRRPRRRRRRELRLAVLRGQRPAGRLRRGRPEHAARTCTAPGRRARRRSTRTATTPRSSRRLVPDRRARRSAGMAFDERRRTTRRTTTARCSSPTASRGCIWVMKRAPAADPDPSQLVQFVGGAGGAVQVVTGPGGDIFYVDLEGGQVRRVVYNGANHPPTAVISASPTSGAAPLTVNFDGSGSSDLDPGDTLSYAWDLDGDGQFDDSTAVAPTHTYTAAGTVTARLRVTDPHGASDTESVTITVGAANSPPVPVIDAPDERTAMEGRRRDRLLGARHRCPGRHVAREPVVLVGGAEPLPEQLPHPPVQSFTGVAGGTFPAPDHEYPSSLSLVLTATDSAGASASTSLQLDPQDGEPDLRHHPERAATGRRRPGRHDADHTDRDRRVVEQRERPEPTGGRRRVVRVQVVVGRRCASPQRHRARHRRRRTPPRSSVRWDARRRRASTTPCPRRPGLRPPRRLPDGRVAYSALGSDGKYYLVATDIISDPLAVGPVGVPRGHRHRQPGRGGGHVVRCAVRPHRGQRRSGSAPSPAPAPAPGPGSRSAAARPPARAAVVTAGDVVHLVVRGTNGAVYHARAGARPGRAGRALVG